MKHRAASPPAQGGWRRRVYTKNHVFRIQKQKGKFVSLGLSGLPHGQRRTTTNSIPASSSVYLITLSARASTVGGIVKLICLAAFKLMMNSNFLGCSTGRSAGLAPFKILSTYVAARRSRSAVFAP